MGKNFDLEKASAILDAIDEVLYVADPKTYELLYLNAVGINTWGDIVGEKCYRGLQGLDAPCSFCTNDKIFGEYLGKTYAWEFQNQKNSCWYRCLDRAIDWPDGRRVRFELAIDITKQKEAEALIRRQSDEILELSTPVIKVWEGIVAAPLIGTLDSERAQQFMDRFLNAISSTESHIALLDITGVPEVDTQTAQHVMETITAARLLGTKIILTGVRPSIAQTMVQLGIDFGSIEIGASLAEGLKLAFRISGIKICNAKTG